MAATAGLSPGRMTRSQLLELAKAKRRQREESQRRHAAAGAGESAAPPSPPSATTAAPGGDDAGTATGTGAGGSADRLAAARSLRAPAERLERLER